MLNQILSLHPILQAALATLFTWSITAIGASFVYFFKNINKNLMDGMLGFAAGVMIAASFFSLLAPAITMAENLKLIPWLITFLGFFSGGLLLFIGDKIYDLYEKKHPHTEEKKFSAKRCVMLVSSITLHNIPEGMAVSVPLVAGGMGRIKSALLTALSGLPTVFGALLGYVLGGINDVMLVVSLGFASGAMLYVVFCELLPEAILMWKSKLPAFTLFVGVLVGFLLVLF